MRRRTATAALTCLLSVLGASVSAAADRAGSLTLDGLSFLSFENAEPLAIPSGSTIQFRFAPSATNGAVTFTINPADVSIDAIPLSGGRGKLTYRLAGPASGTIEKGDGGHSIRFSAQISVTRTDGASSTEATYPLQFTTENASAVGSKTGNRVSVDGMKVVPQARYVQLVGATPNGARAFPHPGRAVYTVLSGTFDWLPPLD